MHDPVTQEFINIGVAVYSPEARFLRAICSPHYARITRMFAKIDGNRFRQLTRFIEEQVGAIGASLPTELPFDHAVPIETILARVLPHDDSAFQFAPPGAGLSRDLDRTTADLFHRYVDMYVDPRESTRRTDEDIWKTFREPLDRRHITPHLESRRMKAANYAYDFERAWKNHVWHLCEPVSF